MMEDFDITMKIIVVGNGGVGKTSLTQRFAKNIFTNEYKKTLGVDFLHKKKYIKEIDREIEFHIWDTAGQDYYDSITRRYYKGASAAILVFSTTDLDSYQHVKVWKEKVDEECVNIPIALVLNKIDVTENVVVTEDMAFSLSNQLNIKLFKTSVKDNIQINEVFDYIATDFMKRGLNVVDVHKENINERKSQTSSKIKVKRESLRNDDEDEKPKTFKLGRLDEYEGSTKKKKKKCC